MNETYLLIMGVVMLITSFGWLTTDMHRETGAKATIVFFGIITSALLLLLSGVLPSGDSIVITRDATNTRVGNELIIQTVGWPTQNLTDIKFIDKPVKIVETTYRNAWGGRLNTTYSVIIDSSEKQ